MHLETLTEKSSRVKQAIHYNTSTKKRRKDNVIVLDGAHLVREAIEKYGAKNIVSFFVTDDALARHEVMNIASHIDARLGGIVSNAIMSRIATTASPQGILAICKQPVLKDIESPSFVLALEDVQDPVNVGTMIRTSASLGVGAVLLSKACADAWSPRALRASQGAHFYTHIQSGVDLEREAGNFDGMVFGSVLGDDTISLFECDMKGPAMIIMGNEGAGITYELQQQCTHKVQIPMQGQCESLNVASACAMICSEKIRQDLL